VSTIRARVHARRRAVSAASAWCALAAAASPVRAQAGPPSVCDAVWHDAGRGRDVPVRIRMPAGSGRVPVILFSHGLGGSLDSGTSWAQGWAASGLATVQLQHKGSDRSILAGARGQGEAGLLAALRAGMGIEQFVARTADVRFVLDELGRRPAEGACDLSRIDLARVGMAGHSFGAITTQAVSGEAFPLGGSALREPRIRAAIAFSPSPPTRATSADAAAVRSAFAPVSIPFFSVTGTADEVPMLTTTTPEQRTWPFSAMPAGGKYLLVLAGADHMAFNGNDRQDALARAAAGAQVPGALQAHVDSVVTAATVAFWKATLLDDAAARALLEGGLKGLLAPGDRFERK